MSGAFNPRAGTFGDFTTKPKMNISIGSVGSEVGYLEGVLFWCCSAWEIYVDPNYGPWYFTAQDRSAVIRFQQFWGLPQTGSVDQTMWGYIDYVAFLNGRG